MLLLEAGPEDSNFWIHVPMGYARLHANPSVNWMYESEPEPELNGRTTFQPRGKVLGGTSSINGMLYMRGHRADSRWRVFGSVFRGSGTSATVIGTSILCFLRRISRVTVLPTGLSATRRWTWR